MVYCPADSGWWEERVAAHYPGAALAAARILSPRFGLVDGLLDGPVLRLSTGERQRLALIRALVLDPPVLLLDEPTGALDEDNTALVEAVLQERLAAGTTILMVTHDAFTASWCSRIVFIKDGLLFNELRRGDMPRKAFYQSILQVLAVMGGGNGNAD